MNKKTLETILYSTGGILAMAGILIAVNVIAGAFKERLDLTKEKAYTLSAGTKNILKQLDGPIKVSLYCSQGEATPQEILLRDYARTVEDLLTEYKLAAHGKLTVERINPEPDSDAEDSARMDGVEGQMMPNGDRFYLGVVISSGIDRKEAISYLDPSRERLLEYDLSRAITRVTHPEKATIGIMSPLPVFGAPSNPMMARMGQQGQQPWVLVTELKNDFNVVNVPMDTDKIDDDIKVLMVVHPREISDKAQFAIDQFVLRGGKLMAFLDPLPMFDTREQNQMLGNIPNSGSSLDKLIKAWGLSFDTSKVVADMKFKMQVGGRNNQPADAPAILGITPQGMNTNDIVTSLIDSLWLPYAGAFTGTPVSGLKEEVLVKSTRESQLVDGFMANLGGDNIMKDFKPSGTEYALAVRLTGKFKTAFPDGKPEDKKDDKDASKKDAGKKADESKPGDFLKESAHDNSVILVGDSDMLNDRVALRPVQTLFGGAAYMPANGNFSFVQNAVELLTGDSNLIAVRSRATVNRPFTKIQAIEAAANEKFQSEIKRLEDSASEAQRKINELQQQKQDKDQRFILSKEQNDELVNLRKEEVESHKRLRQVQKDFRKEVVALQTRVKWINILAVPAAVTASGIALAFVKRKKTSAK